MTVICVDAKPRPTDIYDSRILLKEGHPYTVLYFSEGVDVYGKYGYACFLLYEYEDTNYVFECNRFRSLEKPFGVMYEAVKDFLHKPESVSNEHS